MYTSLQVYKHSITIGFLYIQFPYCTDDEAISVACLDLHYSVSSHTNVLLKPDTHMPATLISSMQEESSSTSGDSIEHVNLEGSIATDFSVALQFSTGEYLTLQIAIVHLNRIESR